MDTTEMLKSAKSYLIFEGVLTALFGLAILLWPGVSLATVILFVGFYGIIKGISMLFKGIFAQKGESDRALSMVMGVLALIFGILVLNVPQAFAAYTTLLIAALIGVQGIYYLVSSFTHNKETTGSRVLLFISGVISILFTFWVISNPKAGAIALLFYLAMMLIFSGAAIIAVGVSLKAK